MKRPIAISLSPNTENDDVLLALKTVFQIWSWRDPKSVVEFENKFAQLFGKKVTAVATISGRSAEYLILKSIGVGKGDEIILQAFNCIAVAEPVIWLGSRPVYCDIGNDYNLDPILLREKISEKTRAVIVQNTFGIAADLQKIKKVIHQKEMQFGTKIFLIEDNAHSLGLKVGFELAGTESDFSFFSFGRDKVLSSVFGGIIVTDSENAPQIRKLINAFRQPSRLWVKQQLLHPILFSIILPLYTVGLGKITLGKILLYCLQRLNLLSFPVSNDEKLGKQPKMFSWKMPGALAILAGKQLDKLQRYNIRRSEIAREYFRNLSGASLILPDVQSNSVWLRFPVRHPKAKSLFNFLKRNRILAGNWYAGILQPKVNLTKFGYTLGSCPIAEKFSEEIVNLPTYPTMTVKDTNKVITYVKKWENSQLKK